MREHWKNGEENMDVLAGPEAAEGDGYYYYDEHMVNVTVPTIAVLSYLNGIVRAEDVVTMLMEGKTWNESDEYHLIPNTGHADIPLGLNAPYVTFPYIGAWLDEVCAKDAAQASVKSPSAADDDDDTIQPAAAADDNGSDSGCFISVIKL